MREKAQLKRKICELDFAIHELVLFLDTHPVNMKAMELLKKYRQKRKEYVTMYEEKFGPYIVTSDDVPANSCWKWLDSPWPWEINFMED